MTYKPIQQIDPYHAIYRARRGDVPCKVMGIASNGYLRIVIRCKGGEPPREYFYDHNQYVAPFRVVRSP